MSRVCISRAAEGLESIVNRILDDSGLDFAGRLVWVKPNMLGPFPSRKGVTTSPHLLKTVVSALLFRAARVVVGDNPGHLSSSQEKVARACGILEASSGCFADIGRSVRQVSLGGDWSSLTVNISSIWLDADIIISMPRLKTHALTTMTGALKNMFGGVAGGGKSFLHTQAPTAQAFASLLLEVYRLRPPDLHIIDALTVMEGNGPSGGRLRRAGMILSGTDGAALDSVGAAIMGLRPEQVPMLREAARLELGETSLDRIVIDGELEPLEQFKVPGAALTSLANRFNSLSWIYMLTPVPIPSRCIECGACVRSCASGAVTLSKRPRIDRDRCISCFCCAEVCPEEAFRIPRIRENIWRSMLWRLCRPIPRRG